MRSNWRLTKRSCSTTPPSVSGSAAAISPSMSPARRASKLFSTAVRKAPDSTTPPTTRPSMVQIAAAAISRAASEFSLRASSLRRAKGRVFQAVTKAAHGMDQVGVQFLAQAADKDFDGVGIAVEILIVKMLHQFGARNDLAAMMGEIGQETIFQAGELDRIAVQGHSAGARVYAQGTDFDVGSGDARRAAQQGAQPRQQFLGVKRFGEIIVGAGIEPRHLVAPAVAG